MTDETREQDLVGKYFGANRNADDRTMKQACERLKSDAYTQGLAEGRRQAVEEALKELAHYKDLFEYKEDYWELKKELEKLKQ